MMKQNNSLLSQKRKEKKAKKLLNQAKLCEQKSPDQEEEPVSVSPSTVTIAIAGSILENAQSKELRSYLAGQIARAGCIFQVDEIVVFDDSGDDGPSNKRAKHGENGDESENNVKHCCSQLARILQYLECPQYLRKFFFPLHKDLKFSGLLNPLDAPNHLRQSSKFQFREGVISNKLSKSGRGCFANIGLLNDIFIDNQSLSPGIRVTCKLKDYAEGKKVKAEIVPPNRPRIETGVYWGYTVRLAKSLSQVITQCPYEEGYDVTIGTSDRGKNVYEIEDKAIKFNHALIIFGGTLGLEYALENDNDLNVEDPELLFDHYVNTVPSQGSRTIRTEEAILISLACLKSKLNPENPPKPFLLADAIPQSVDTKTVQVQRKVPSGSGSSPTK